MKMQIVLELILLRLKLWYNNYQNKFKVSRETMELKNG